MARTQTINALNKSLIFLIALFFLAFPLIISSGTTDAYFLPKKFFLICISLLGLILWGVQQVFQKSIILRKTTLSLFILFFAVVLTISSFLSISPIDSAAWTIPVIASCLLAFLITQTIVKKEQLDVLLMSSATGIGALALICVGSFFKFYLLPFSFTHTPSFTPFGALIDQAVLFFAATLFCLFAIIRHFRKKTTPEYFLTLGGLFLYLAGLTITLVLLFTTQRPLILPLASGLQISFATLSQDTTRLIQSILFGSGPNTYYMDFTRFKQPSFNSYTNLWFLSYSTSTSLILDLMATTGAIGLVCITLIIIFICRLAKKNTRNMLVPTALALSVAILILPTTFLILVYFLLAAALLEVSTHVGEEKNDIFEVSLVTKHNQQFSFSLILPNIILLLILALVGATGWYCTTYLLSDMQFQKSLVAANANNGSATYTDQLGAIRLFPYRDVYYRAFSQTNLTLANALIGLTTQKNASPTSQEQSQVLQLIQQSITSARSAISLSPYNTQNWQNLGGIYQSLIGFGQNADSFSISSYQQALALDPSNPQLTLTLGGVYYQLGQWTNAIRAFQAAVGLKPDFANGYYNLGHAYEQTNDYPDALQSFQAVAILVKSDAQNEQKISQEIAAVQQKLNSGQSTSQTSAKTPTVPTQQPEESQGPLQVSGPNPVTPAVSTTPIPLPTAGK